MNHDEQSPQYMTPAELEAAIRRHREQAKRLLAEVRARRYSSENPIPLQENEAKPSPTA